MSANTRTLLSFFTLVALLTTIIPTLAVAAKQSGDLLNRKEISKRTHKSVCTEDDMATIKKFDKETNKHNKKIDRLNRKMKRYDIRKKAEKSDERQEHEDFFDSERYAEMKNIYDKCGLKRISKAPRIH